MKLPKPSFDSNFSVEKALYSRRSIREYRDDPVPLEAVSQLLWSAYGVTDKSGYRTAPSAMTAYPLEIYLVSVSVKTLKPGLYKYEAHEHSLEARSEQELGQSLYECTFDQESVRQGKAIFVFTAVYERTIEKLGDSGKDHVHMDVGHAGQNLHLQAVALGLGTVVIGAFRPEEVKKLLGLPEDETPLYLMPVGYPE